MNKRIICLLLSAIMLLSVILPGCSKKTDDEAMENVTETASESTMTLTMYLMSESEVSEEQASKIEEAVNKITKSKFKTRLVLRYFTSEQMVESIEGITLMTMNIFPWFGTAVFVIGVVNVIANISCFSKLKEDTAMKYSS